MFYFEVLFLRNRIIFRAQHHEFSETVLHFLIPDFSFSANMYFEAM